MKLRKSTEKNYVRILVGTSEIGFKGIRKPIFVISVDDASAREVHDFILDAIKIEIGEKP